MKATKKIVGAACALVAAVALSAGSTFAWFASNNTVTATNMLVQATVPMNLYIESNYVKDITTINKTTITMSGKGDTMSTVAISTTEATSGTEITDGSAVGGATVTGGKLYALNAKFGETGGPTSSDKGTPNGYEKIATGTAGASSFTWAAEDTYTAANYVVSDSMTLANKSSDAKISAEVEVKWTATTNTYKFLRTGFLVGIPGSSDSVTYTFYSLENVTGKGELKATGDKVTYTDLIAKLANNSVAYVTFLAWFDGNDADCFVNNATSVGQFTINLSFSATKIEAAGVGG